MKRLFFAVVALSLFATSCAKDDAAAPEATGKTKTVTFSVKAPEMKTRAATGDGTTANVLYYAFYDETGAILPAYTNIYPPKDGELPGDTWDGITGKTISVTLVEGRTYSAIFWAQSSAVDNDEKGKKLYVPDLETSKTVTFDFSTHPASYNASTPAHDHYDAFYATLTDITTDNAQSEVMLKRPFAQLNIGASKEDIESAGDAGVKVMSQAVTITVPTKLNLMTGEVSEEKEVTLGWAPAESIAYPADAADSPTHTILSVNYILVGKDVADKELATVKFHMSEKTVADNETYSDAITRTYTAVPIQRNYRTYILGNVITSNDAATVYTVKIDPAFTTPDKTVTATDTTGDSTGDTN